MHINVLKNIKYKHIYNNCLFYIYRRNVIMLGCNILLIIYIIILLNKIINGLIFLISFIYVLDYIINKLHFKLTLPLVYVLFI